MKKKLILTICVIGLTLFTACSSDASSVRTSNAPAPTSADDNSSSTPTVDQSTEESQTKENIPESEVVDEPFIEKYDNEIVVCATMTLDKYISNYKISLAPQRWTLANFNEDGAIIAISDVTFENNNETKTAMVIFTPILDGDNMTGGTPHYISVGDVVYGNDGYCDDFFSNIEKFINAQPTEPEQTRAPETATPDAATTITESEANAQPSAEPAPEPALEPAPNTANQGENGENFNTYDNQEQQNTTELVLNKGTMKIHNPWCSAVAKISPDNYETTTLSVAELEAQGYVKCKQKGDW